MKRKVIQIAESTQLVSLPRKWALKYGVKKGDEVDVLEEGNKIVVSTGVEDEKKSKIDINITDLDKDSLIFLLRALFIRQYDEISLRFDRAITKHHRVGDTVRFLSVIHGEISRSIGFEIIQQRGNSVIIKRITASSMKEFEGMLRRIFLLILDAVQDLQQGLANLDYDLLESLEEKHDSVTKFIVYTLGILNTHGYTNYKDTPFLFHIIYSLDTIIDILRDTSRRIISEKIIPSKDSAAIFDEIKKAMNLFYELFYHFSLKKAEEFSGSRDRILLLIKRTARKLTKEDLRVLIATEQCVEILRDMSSARMAMEY